MHKHKLMNKRTN